MNYYLFCTIQGIPCYVKERLSVLVIFGRRTVCGVILPDFLEADGYCRISLIRVFLKIIWASESYHLLLKDNKMSLNLSTLNEKKQTTNSAKLSQEIPKEIGY